MRQMFTGLVAAVAAITLGAVPAMACGGGGLFSSSCSPCGQAYVSPCGQSYYGGGHGYAGYGHHYQRLAAPSPRYFWVNQGPAYDGPGQFAPRPFYQERTVSGWRGYHRGHYGYTGGPYANPMNHHYFYGGPAWRGPAITSYRWRHHVRPAPLRYGHHSHSNYRHAVRPSARHGHSHIHRHNVRSDARYGYAPRSNHAPRYGQRQVQRVVAPQASRTPRFRDSGSYSYRNGFRVAPNARQH